MPPSMEMDPAASSMTWNSVRLSVDLPQPVRPMMVAWEVM